MKRYQSENGIQRIERQHEITINRQQNPFNIIKPITAETKLRAEQYKMLMGISITKKLLFRWQKEDDNQCTHCGSIETVSHVIYDCDIAQETFENLATLYKLYGNDITLTKTNIILVNTTDKALAVIIILIKDRLLKQRNEKRVITMTEIDHLTECQKKQEIILAIRKDKKTKGNSTKNTIKKWKNFEKTDIEIEISY